MNFGLQMAKNRTRVLTNISAGHHAGLQLVSCLERHPILNHAEAREVSLKRHLGDWLKPCWTWEIDESKKICEFVCVVCCILQAMHGVMSPTVHYFVVSYVAFIFVAIFLCVVIALGTELLGLVAARTLYVSMLRNIVSAPMRWEMLGLVLIIIRLARLLYVLVCVLFP